MAMLRLRGILCCLIAAMVTEIRDATKTTPQADRLSSIGVVALYPLTKATLGKDVIGQHNDIQFSNQPHEWLIGPTGLPNTAKSVCAPGEWEGIMGIDNHNRRLSIKPSMGFFTYIRHYDVGPIMEYDNADTSGPAELPDDWENYVTIPALYLMVHYNNPTALFFNLGNANPEPTFDSITGLTIGQWQHVGFTFDDTTKEFKFWVDGKVISTHTLANGLGGTTDKDRIRLGYRANYKCFRSEMTCVSFHNKALTEDDVQTLIATCKEYALTGTSTTTTTTTSRPSTSTRKPTSSAPLASTPKTAWMIGLSVVVAALVNVVLRLP